MRKILWFSAAMGLAALALWSAWNPGYYYLTRAAVFTVMGAGATFFWMRALGSRYAATSGLFYVTIVLSVAVVEEALTAPPGQVESINLVLIPLAVAFLLATIVEAAVTARPGAPSNHST